jgi:5-methylcytosine-specific restriction endonuclease McrA
VTTTLLLNASFEPLCIVPLRRAVVLVLAEKADVLAADDMMVRSAMTAMAAPRVIRLRAYVRVPYRAVVPLTRRALIVRDDGRCQYCRRHVGAAGTVDHVVPRSQFARRADAHQWGNVVLACRPCNGKKGDRTLAELGWTLDRTPVALTRRQWLIVGYAEVEPVWVPYLTAAAA